MNLFKVVRINGNKRMSRHESKMDAKQARDLLNSEAGYEEGQDMPYKVSKDEDHHSYK